MYDRPTTVWGGRTTSPFRGRAAAVALAIGALVLAGAAVALADDIICTGGSCTGTGGNDTMTGTPERDEFNALEGNDDMFGRRGDDEFRGAGGNDDFYGGAGNDVYYYLQSNWDADRVKADRAGGEDWLVIFSGAAESLLVDLRPTPGQKEVVLGTNTINFARDVSIEWVQAGSGPDEVIGNPRSNYILGGDDGDTLSGRGGDDRLIGDIQVFSNVGNDRLRGGAGRDRLEGGDGNDTILARDGERDRIRCGEGVDTVRFDSGLDRVGASCEI